MKRKRTMASSVLFLFAVVALLLSLLALTGCSVHLKTPAENSVTTSPNAETTSSPEPTDIASPEPPKYIIDLIGEFPTLHVLGDGKFTRDNERILADNLAVGDTALMRTVKIEPGEHVLIEIRAILHEGTAFGVMIGENNYDDSFKTGWFCVNADVNQRGSRLFGTKISNVAALIKDRNFGIGKETCLALEILPDKTIRAYYEGKEYTDDTVVIEDFDGGYPGIMTYKGRVEFTSATLTYIGKEGP